MLTKLKTNKNQIVEQQHDDQHELSVEIQPSLVSPPAPLAPLTAPQPGAPVERVNNETRRLLADPPASSNVRGNGSGSLSRLKGARFDAAMGKLDEKEFQEEVMQVARLGWSEKAQRNLVKY